MPFFINKFMLLIIIAGSLIYFVSFFLKMKKEAKRVEELKKELEEKNKEQKWDNF